LVHASLSLCLHAGSCSFEITHFQPNLLKSL
jgi:hypothetical protein